MRNLPSHVPIFISPNSIDAFQEALERRGYTWTFFQIIKPKQVVGMVKEVIYQDMEVEHHVRAYTSGKITAEIELRRLKDVWLHLTSHSISAHEDVITLLEEEGIAYEIDADLRQEYLEHGPTEFRRDYMEFWRWLIYGCLFWIPVTYFYNFCKDIASIFTSRWEKGQSGPSDESLQTSRPPVSYHSTLDSENGPHTNGKLTNGAPTKAKSDQMENISYDTPSELPLEISDKVKDTKN